jgi:hypothetical protein
MITQTEQKNCSVFKDSILWYFVAVVLGCIIAFFSATEIMLGFDAGVARVKALMTLVGINLCLSIIAVTYFQHIASIYLTFSFTLLLTWNIFHLKNFVFLKV